MSDHSAEIRNITLANQTTETFATEFPHTPITPEAEKQLTKWGIEDQAIEQLRTIMDRFHYDKGPEKMENIARNPVFVDTAKNEIHLPFFFDTKARGVGQCVDLAMQLATAIHASGWIDDVNEDLKAQHRKTIGVNFCYGLAPTFFCNEGDTHVWLSIVQNLRRKQISSEQVVIDPSFHTITTDPKYRQRGEGTDIIELAHDQNAKIRIGSLQIDAQDGSFSIKELDPLVLGLSHSFKYSLNLAFAKTEDDTLYPILVLYDMNGDRVGRTLRINGETRVSDKFPVLTPEENSEIEEMLNAAQGFRYEEDLSKMLPDLGVTVSFAEPKRKSFIQQLIQRYSKSFHK